MDRINWIKMARTNWLKWRTGSEKKPHYLQNRVVFCVDCESNRSLVCESGTLMCSSCGSQNWMFLASGIVAKFKTYDEQIVKNELAVRRISKRMRKEEFFAPDIVMV